MSPILNKAEAKKNGWAQTREALLEFKGLCTKADFGMWGGSQIDEKTGLPKPPKEFLEIVSTGNIPLVITEELSMDITAEYSFRVNTSDFEGSFWVEKFLDEVGKLDILLPTGLVNKVVTWRKVTQEAKSSKGERQPKFDSTNYVPVAIEEPTIPLPPLPAAPVAIPAVAKPEIKAAQPVQSVVQAAPVSQTTNPAVGSSDDFLSIVLSLAVGKTDVEFKNACKLHPKLATNPLQPLIQAGAVTNNFIKEGKLVLVADPTKGADVYALPVSQ